jgi:putative phosphoribosyl transferase
VMRLLALHGLATLWIDGPDASETQAGHLARAVVPLAERLIEALDWAAGRADLAHLHAGLWATGMAAAAALIAATQRSARVAAVVASSGRPDLAGPALARVAVPTLLVVGGNDPEGLSFNRAAMLALTCEKRLEVVPGAATGFEEPGAMEAVAHLAGAWLAGRLSAGFARH